METVKLVLVFLCCGLLASVFGYAIDGAEASIVFALHFGLAPLVMLPTVALVDSLHCRYRRWRRTWKSIVLI